MKIKKIEDYKGTSYRSFPNENKESHQNKKEDWYIAYLSSILHRGVTGNGAELIYGWEYLNNLERYAKGTQGNKKVKEKMLRMDKNTGKFKGRMKDIFQTFDILPEMIDVILSTNMKADYKPVSVAVDEVSIKDKKQEMSLLKFLLEKNTKEFMEYMKYKPDVPLTDEELSAYTSADIDVLYQTGGIQLQREMACVSVCNTTLLYSKAKEIENMNSFDLITYGICANRTYWDYNEKAAKIRYVDVKNLIMPKSKYNDFRDSSFFAEVRMMTIAEVVSECGKLEKDVIEQLIYSNAKFNGDFAYNTSDLEGYYAGSNDIFDEYRIAALDAQWLATDIEMYLHAPTKNGGQIYKRIDNDFRITNSKKKQGQKLDRKQFIKKYNAIWVIGSEILLDYGQASNVAYGGPKGARIPKLDYTVRKTGKKSLVDRCRTIVDDINLAIAKLRSAIATLPPAPRMVVYDHALQNIKFGNILQSPKDLFDGFSENGIMVVNGLDKRGNPYSGNGGKAVEFMNSGVAEDITIFSNEATQKVNMLRQVLGLPEGLDGTAGQKYQLASTMQLAASASSNALFPTLSQIGSLYEGTFDVVIPLWQTMCHDEDLSIEEIGLSERVVNVFKIGKDFSNYEFKIKVAYAPTEAEKEFLFNKLNEATALYTQTNGAIGITQAEFLMLYKLIKAGLIDEAMMRIARIEALRQQANIKAQEATMQQTIQGQQESNRVAEEEKRTTAAINESEKRTTVALEKALQQLADLQMAIIEKNSEGQSVDTRTASSFMQQNQNLAGSIMAQDQQSMNPQQQMQPQGMAQ